MTPSAPPTVYLDLDGPVLDVAARYYAVHCHLCASLELPSGEPGPFWAAKRARTPLPALLATDDAARLERYRAGWAALIESEEFLALDQLQPGALPALAQLSAHCRVVIVTLRQNGDCVRAEIARLVPPGQVSAVHVGSPLAACGEAVKAALIREDRGERAALAMIGDTEVDLRAGKAVGLRTIAVLSGIRCEALLRSEGPDAIVADLGAAVAALLES